MKPEELRIGNLVMYPSGVFYQVDVLYKTYAMLPFWKPIPLTAELLIELGFEHQIFIDKRNYIPMEKKVYQLRKKLVVDNEDGDYMFVMVSDGLFLNGYSINLKYVHELQNLYFSLTGEELTLKKEV